MPLNDDLLPQGPRTYDNETFTKEASRLQVAGAAFQLSWKAAETSSAISLVENKLAERDDDITNHMELNEEYRLPVPLNEPMSRSKFNKLVEEDQERKQLQSIIQNGKQDVGNEVIAFSSGIAAQIVDPIGLALGYGVGKAFAFSAAKGLLGGKALKAAAKAKHLKTPPSLQRRIAEGVTGNVIGEAALVQTAAQQERQGIDVGEAIRNAIIGGIAFPAVMKGLGIGVKKLNNLIQLTSGRMDAGKRPFGGASELELATAVTRDKLNTDIKDLAAKNIEDEISIMEGSKDPSLKENIKERQAKIDELEGQIKAVNKELSNQVDMRKKANSPEQDIYNSKEIAEDLKDFNKKKPKGKLTEDDIAEIEHKRLKQTQEESLAGLDEAEASQLKAEIEAHNNLRDKIPEASKELKKCVEEGLKNVKV